MRTAVIAVHGVGGPERNATARAVADLLVKHGAPNGEYSAFRETCLTLPVRRLEVEASNGEATGGLGGLHIGNRDRTRLALPTAARGDGGGEPPAAQEQPDVAFMRTQLEAYRSSNVPFDTVELVGRRFGPDGARDRDVHVFEMYWADLSRLGSGAARVFGAIFQLIQHVSHLGRKALDIASEVASSVGPTDAEARALRAYAYAHALVVRLFTIFVPVSSMLMLSFVALFVPAAVDPSHRLLAGLVAAAVLVLIVAGVLSFRGSRSERAVSVFVWLMIGVVAVGVIVYARLRGAGDLTGTALLTAVIGTLSLAALLAVLRRYDRDRDGALAWGLVSLGAVAVLTALSATRLVPVGDPAENVRRVGFLGFQWSFIALMLGWGVLWFTTIVAYVIYLLRVRPALGERPAQRARVIRAAWTARVTLAASVFSFVLVALVAYGAIVYLASKVHGHFDLFPHAWPASPLPRATALIVPPDPTCLADADRSTCGIRFFQSLVAAGGTSGLLVALVGAAASLILVSWFFALIAYTAIRDVAQVRAGALGNWMTGGFRWLTRAGSLFAIMTLAAIIVGATLDTLELRGVTLPEPFATLLHRVFSPGETQTILNTLVLAVAASAATVAAFRARLDALASKAKPVLGILLDVDNYLRESPHVGTPRARIAERYVSLLRHVMERENPDGSPFFDRVVIASHSQGTVISADLLRFLEATGSEEGLIDRRLRLLTMGSPLRQLYAEHFPHLYAWIDRSDDRTNDGTDDDALAAQALRIAKPQPPAGELTGRSPSPLWLGVGEWVNLFTTGDYVGRTLWRTEVPETWTPQTVDTASTGFRRRERCLGSGTHTHYWSSAAVAEELDRLIAARGTRHERDRARRGVAGDRGDVVGRPTRTIARPHDDQRDADLAVLDPRRPGTRQSSAASDRSSVMGGRRSAWNPWWPVIATTIAVAVGLRLTRGNR